VAVLLVSITMISAAGAGAVTYTQTFHNATDSFPAANPCTGAPSTATLTYNGVMHYTVNKAGDVWATGTQTGSFVLVPDDPTQPTYTGHFTTWFGVSDIDLSPCLKAGDSWAAHGGPDLLTRR
jgi:hypothetical protein